MALETRNGPGWGLETPPSVRRHGFKSHASAECRSVFEDVPPPPRRVAVRGNRPRCGPPDTRAPRAVDDEAVAGSRPMRVSRFRDATLEVWRAGSPYRSITRELADDLGAAGKEPLG